ncbi:hypothetical protein [Geobacter sulfurreducens]|uniref:hypothetical protein n=1 Tax=Geobacter sulfurreducens TaxID=35554 RepID=UPI0020B7C238|nr:hypothetical protein [Geobacter sulfurreducens]
MSFHDIPNPTGGMPVERVIDRPTPEEHLLERILATENMDLAWKRVRANKCQRQSKIDPLYRLIGN